MFLIIKAAFRFFQAFLIKFFFLKFLILIATVLFVFQLAF